MLGRVKLRLALLFILLTSIVYLTTSSVGVFRFWNRMNNALDEEISTLASESMSRIHFKNGIPEVHASKIKFHQHVSIKVYGSDGTLLDRIGDDGIPTLSKDPRESDSAEGIHYRSKTFPLSSSSTSPNASVTSGSGATPEGYLQVQVATTQRDAAIRTYFDNMMLLAPVLLTMLTVAGLFFARWAVRPIEMAMVALKRFLADAGHELGTPLAILRTTADNLSLDVAGMPEAEERVETLTRTTERMAKLVQDMTHLARLEAAELSIDWQTLHLDQLVSETVGTFKELFAQKNLTVVLKAEGAVVKGDKHALERLLVNLLQNAIRYTDEGGTITVNVSSKDNSAILSVSDTGIGIPAEALPHIFERFYRVDKARSRAAGGSGLGLAIVKITALAHGGAVTVSSEEGKGTKFTVTLPLSSHS